MSEPGLEAKEGAASAAPPALRAARDSNAYAAFGRAVSYLMTKPNFENLKFGFWSKTLAGQVNRKHYFFVMQGEKVVGFAGWAMVDEANAKAWARDNTAFPSGDCVNGDCIVINAWAADDDRINRFVLRELRKYCVNLKGCYAKRYYQDGRVRVLELPITEALGNHVVKGG